MSELKAHKAYNRWLDEEMPTPNDDLICNEVYLKYEADKVIAHQKYKRCLANAWWCRKLSNVYALAAYTHRGWKIARYYDEKAELYRKWRKRWLTNAEKFKPNSTAQ